MHAFETVLIDTSRQFNASGGLMIAFRPDFFLRTKMERDWVEIHAASPETSEKNSRHTKPGLICKAIRA
jgi:hypothetical protein